MDSTDISNVIVDESNDSNAISIAPESASVLTIAPAPLKKRSAKAIRENRKETLGTLMALGLESFKVFMACMLSLFVSQKCGDHECSFNEKFSEETVYAKFVLALNFISLAVFIFVYNIEFCRERYIIKHFNDNNKFADDHIKEIIDYEPGIKKQLFSWNKRFYFGTVSAIGLGTINFIISGHFIFANHYNGAKTMTSIITNVLLVSNSLSSNYRISKKSYNEHMAISSSRLEPISYNEFDKFITQHNTELQAYLKANENVVLPDEESKEDDENCHELDISCLKMDITG